MKGPTLDKKLKDFLQKYKDALQDLSLLLAIGRHELKQSMYTQLLILLHDANINLDTNFIFDRAYDQKKILWADNRTVLDDFYINLPTYNINIPELQDYKIGDLLDYLLKLKFSKYYPIEIFSKLTDHNNVSSSIKIALYLDKDLNRIHSQLILKDIDGNEISVVKTPYIGVFYDNIGYAWDSNEFDEDSNYLIDLIKNIKQG